MSQDDATHESDRMMRGAMLRLIGIGGSAVLASYLLAFDPEVGSRLWGGIPEGPIRSLYTVNMLLAAVGFFPATWWLVFATPASALRERTGWPAPVLMLAYAAILMASALWLPLTALYVKSPMPILWFLIRFVLLVVGAGASVVGFLLVRLALRGRPAAWLAVPFYLPFWLQTMVLDALVWPHYYSLDA